MMIRAVVRPPISLKYTRRYLSNDNSNKPTPFHLRLWNSYSDSLHKRPLPTKCSAAALIFFISDSVTQYVTRKNQLEDFKWDPWRAISGAVFGVVATSYLHFWWGGLELIGQRVVPVERSRIGHTAVKVVMDQALGAPVYVYSYYVVTNFLQSVVAGVKPGEAFQESRRKADGMLWETMLRHWKLWPAVHSFNFYYVPLHHRVLVQNLVLVGWSGYLSHLNNGGLMTPKSEIELTRRVTSLRVEKMKQAQTR